MGLSQLNAWLNLWSRRSENSTLILVSSLIPNVSHIPKRVCPRGRLKSKRDLLTDWIGFDFTSSSNFFHAFIVYGKKLLSYLFVLVKGGIADLLRKDISPNFIYKVHKPVGLKYLTRLRMGLSHLKSHKFLHDFNDTLDQYCVCDNKPIVSVTISRLNQLNTTYCFVLFSATCRKYRPSKWNKYNSVSQNILYGSESYSVTTNTFILQCTINYIMNTWKIPRSFHLKSALAFPLQYFYVFLYFLNVFTS